MGLAKYAVKKTNKDKTKKNKIFLIVGIVMMLLAAVWSAKDIYYVINFERVESTVKVVHKPKKGKHAYVTYEYQGERYEDKVLSYYNAFTMKNGKELEVLINPEKPDQPYITTFFWDAVIMFFGITCVILGLKKDNTNDA
ncbi:MAG: DUF3592 domain-containing protein [Eubacterium sp.]|nr:DUF3592 domain-containing protein [Eubacterium sp.]